MVPLRMQIDALCHLFRPEDSERKMLLVTRTGGGKSHVLRLVGTLLRAVHLVLHPLLVLTADQMPKFLAASDAHGPHSAYNLDKFPASSLSLLCSDLVALKPKTTRTIYLFSSP